MASRSAEMCAGCRASAEKSIKDLGCEYLDLLLMHWPDAWTPGTQDSDDTVTIEQTWCGSTTPLMLTSGSICDKLC